MSMMVSFVLSFFPRDVLDEILNLIESVSEDFLSCSYGFLILSNEVFNCKRNMFGQLWVRDLFKRRISCLSM